MFPVIILQTILYKAFLKLTNNVISLTNVLVSSAEEAVKLLKFGQKNLRMDHTIVSKFDVRREMLCLPFFLCKISSSSKIVNNMYSTKLISYTKNYLIVCRVD